MRRFFCIVVAFFLITALLVPVAAAQPQHTGIARVTQAVQSSVGVDTPGAAVVLLENGTRLLYEGYGYADITARTLVTAESLFELGELSSLFVALAVQRLVDAQALELDRDIAYYLPADFSKKLDLAHPITLNDLLSGHASFADRYFDLRYESPSLVFDTLEEALLADVPAQTDAVGTFYAYSRFGITLAAFVVECVSGMDYATYVEEQILHPLGMTHTVLAPHREQAEKMASGHAAKGEGSFAVAAESGRTYSALWPADGALSNVADLSLLLQELLKGGAGAQILLPAFENGVFQTGMAGLGVSGAVRAITAHTPHFSASLCLDFGSARAALVLCDNNSSALLSASYKFCGFLEGMAGLDTDSMLPDPAQYEGEYILRTKENGVLSARTVKNMRVSMDSAGMLFFGDRRLVQIAPGMEENKDFSKFYGASFVGIEDENEIQ